MKIEKLSLKGIKSVLSRSEMKQVMAGSGGGSCGGMCCWTGSASCSSCSSGATASNSTCQSGASFVACTWGCH